MKIKILSVNMWLLPPPASLNNNKRIDDLVTLIRKLDPDVINLQEVWLKAYATTLKKHFPNYSFTTPKSFFFNKSGLITLSKHKLVSKKFHKFKTHKKFTLLEKLAKKGFLRTQYQVEGRLISIINAHIYQSNEETSLKIKINQINQVLNIAKENGPAIVAGDLNTRPIHYDRLLKKFTTEKEIPVTYSGNNKYSHAMVNALMNKNGVYNQFPDRIFYYIRTKKTVVKAKTIKRPTISDHYPIFAEITFS